MSAEPAAGTPAAFVSELASVIAAVIEAPGSIRPADALATGGWLVTLTASDGALGKFDLFIERTALERIAKRATGQETEPTEAEVLRALTDWCNDAATAFLQRSRQAGARLVVASVIAATKPEPGSTPLEIVLGDSAVRVAIVGQLDAASAADSRRGTGDQALDAILDIDLPVVVRFGRTEMTLKTLTTLGPGSVIELGRSPDDPVDVLVSNQLLARGEVVIVGGSYGVRITDVMRPGERARALEERRQ
jgi:flagellar motor switch protein FliN